MGRSAIFAYFEMRLWTIHPRYLDAKGLVAAWREGLLAQKVLSGKTKGYKFHPQLIRFQNQSKPVQSLSAFLVGIASEARLRGYHFNTEKILYPRAKRRIKETRGQLLFEWAHLQKKLKTRAPKLYSEFKSIKTPKAHPIFHIIHGKIKDWEKTK
jgi:hypothetical protein